MSSTIKEVFQVLLAVVIPLAAFTTGLRAPKLAQGEVHLWRHPTRVLRDLLAILILVPLWAIFLVRVLPVSPMVRGGLLIAVLAVGIGPASAMKRLAPGTVKASEALDLNAIVLVLSMIFVPIGFASSRPCFIGTFTLARALLRRSCSAAR